MMAGTISHAGDAAHHMDGIYHYQRHIYDLTRKYYLLGRDRLLNGLDAPVGGSVLEVGCGTGRNLICAARTWPGARLYGIDISAAMLVTATAAIRRKGLEERIAVQQGDATDFIRHAPFGHEGFDRIFLSYTLSMIPGWQLALEETAHALGPHGSLHIVDFGQQECLPSAFRALLFAWLAKFDVSPRGDLLPVLEDLAQRHSLSLDFTRLHQGYAWAAILKRTE
ncbi:MAG: class I SAM-dependent methyltransferase [Alphaproteobacteria bacterium]|nr:class I SAM-dependent methyltransferase [Alphaproteobacteria bacterium]